MNDYFSLAIGGGDDQQMAEPVDYFSAATGLTTDAQKRTPEPQEETWGERIINNIRGRQDPKYKDVGTVFEQFRPELSGPTNRAAVAGASDNQMADIIKSNLGDRFIRSEKDSHGYDVFVTRGPDGQEQMGYVNKPGLDMQDVARGLNGSLPYVLTGGAAGAAMKGAGLAANAIAQGVTATGTSVAGDLAQMPMGSNQGVEFDKAAVVGGLGAVGPLVGAAAGWLGREFWTIPGLINKTTGQLTAKGIEAARKAGLNPEDITPDFAKNFVENFAKSGNPATAATEAGLSRYNVPATRGQVTKDPYLLTQEEGMRRRLYGEAAQDTMRGFDQKQAEAIRGAALGDPNSLNTAPKSIAEKMAPGRSPGYVEGDRTAGSLGEGVQYGFNAAKSAAKREEGYAWQKASTLEATPEALAELPAIVNAKLGGRMPNQRATPAAYDMAQELQRIIKQEAPEKAAEFLTANPSRNVDQMRRGLLDILKSAKEDADKSMAGSMYEAFNDWIGVSAKKKLLSGDPQAAIDLVKARGFTRDMRAAFRPTLPDGRPSLAAAKLKKIENADSGEAVIEALFGARGSQSKNEGAVQTLTSLKASMQRYAPESADAAWNDVRLAYWFRLVTGKTGEIVGPQAMASNIKTAMVSQKSVFQTLYTPLEQREIREFVRALDVVAYKPPNASGSGYTAASFAKEGLMKLLGAFGLDKPAAAALQFTKIGDAWNAAAARQAVSKITRPARPNVSPAVNSLALPYAQDRASRDY